VGQKERPGH